MAKQDMGRLLPWLLALLLVLLLGGQARAAGDGGDGEPPTLPRELLEAAPEAAEALEEDGAGGFDLAAGVSKLWASAVEKAKDYLFSGVRSVAAIMAGGGGPGSGGEHDPGLRRAWRAVGHRRGSPVGDGGVRRGHRRPHRPGPGDGGGGGDADQAPAARPGGRPPPPGAASRRPRPGRWRRCSSPTCFWRSLTACCCPWCTSTSAWPPPGRYWRKTRWRPSGSC